MLRLAQHTYSPQGDDD